MIHIKNTIDPETTGAAIIRPRTYTAAEKRAHLAEMRRTAHAILAGWLVIETHSPRNFARYGRTFPTLIGLRQHINMMRVDAPLSQRRRTIYGGAERQSWVERTLELRSRHAARAIQRRRAGRTRRAACSPSKSSSYPLTGTLGRARL